MTTIKDVALQAGVSVATVSRVLNQTQVVSDDLQQRVLDAAKDLNYHPSVVARSLRRRETRTIGVMIPQLDQPFFSALSYAVQKRLFEDDYYALICSTMGNEFDESAYVEMLLGQRVDGVIMVPSGMMGRSVANLLKNHIPVVVVDRDLPHMRDVDSVISDNETGAYQAVNHLLELGHRSIGIISGPTYIITVKRRLSGIQRAFQHENISLEDNLIVTGQFQDFQTGYHAARSLLSRTPRPTAIFALADVMAVGAVHAAVEMGLHVPDDLSVVGFDDLPMAAHSIPALTTVAQPIREMGRYAAEIVMNRLNNPNLKVQSKILKTDLIHRRSTAPNRS